MQLDFWLTRKMYGTEAIDESIVFTSPMYGGNKKFTKVCVVENETEHGLVFVLQMLHGGECPIIYHDGRSIAEYLESYGRVFTTWDPTDRNRI